MRILIHRWTTPCRVCYLFTGATARTRPEYRAEDNAIYARTENIAPALGPYMAPDGVYIPLAAVYSIVLRQFPHARPPGGSELDEVLLLVWHSAAAEVVAVEALVGKNHLPGPRPANMVSGDSGWSWKKRGLKINPVLRKSVTQPGFAHSTFYSICTTYEKMSKSETKSQDTTRPQN